MRCTLPLPVRALGALCPVTTASGAWSASRDYGGGDEELVEGARGVRGTGQSFPSSGRAALCAVAASEEEECCGRHAP